MTIDQWKGYLFTEQLSAAAETHMKKQYPIGDIEIPLAKLDFIQGARWALQSELVKEMEAALKYETIDDIEQCNCRCCLVLQKLKIARGEK